MRRHGFDTPSCRRRIRTGLLGLALALTLAAPVPVSADPPPWAPAHGWRAKQKGKQAKQHRGYVAPFGIGEGTCRRELLGSVLGGVAGAAAGTQIGKGGGRLVAVAGGTILGIIVGGALGRAMDRQDLNCVGQVLEHAADRQQVAWTAPEGAYAVQPVSTFRSAGAYCREYVTRATIGGREQTVHGTACRQPDGAWRLMD